MTRPSKLLVPLLAVAAALVAGCGSSSGSGGEGEDSGPIKVGYVGNFSGWMSAFDEAPLNGVKLALAKINAAGGVDGRKIELSTFDQKTKPALGATGATKLISDGAVALVGACDYDFASTTAVAGQQRKVPTISTCAADPKFGPQGIGQYAYTMGLVSNVTGGTMAEFAHDEQGWKRGYVLEDRSIEYTKSLTKFFTQRFEDLGGELVGHDTFLQADESVAAQITNLKSLDPQPEFVVLTTYAPGLARVIRQLNAAGVDLPILGGDGFDGTWWAESLPNLSNVFYVAGGYVFGPEGKVQYELAQEYGKKFGKAPVNAGFLSGYALGEVLKAAIENADGTSGEAINASLQSLDSVSTVIGDLSFSETEHAPGKRPLAAVEFRNGKPTFIKNITPKEIPNPFEGSGE